MNATLILVIASIVILFLLFLGLLLFRERTELHVEQDRLLVKKPGSNKSYALDQELINWKVQQAVYLRWGRVYSLNLLFKNNRRVGINSRFNPEGYSQLYDYLKRHYEHRRVEDK